MVCMKESFPQLKTRRLTRVEWCKVRRLMGKPRRCSSAFFTEERAELARKRQKIRMLQQRKQLMDYTSFKDLPEQIPLLLTIGARVTARSVRFREKVSPFFFCEIKVIFFSGSELLRMVYSWVL